MELQASNDQWLGMVEKKLGRILQHLEISLSSNLNRLEDIPSHNQSEIVLVSKTFGYLQDI